MVLEGFGSRLQIAMKANGLNQTHLAQKIGVTSKTVSLYLSGKRVPDTYKLYKISIVLSTSADWLIGLKSDKLDDFESYLNSLTPEQRKFVSGLLDVCQEIP